MTLGAVSATIPGLVSCTPDTPGRQTGEKRKLRPALDGEWWLIGASPKLDDLLPAQSAAPLMPPDPEAFGAALVEHGIDPDFLREMQESMQRFGGNRNEPVDHHIFRGADGTWHLWGCVRRTNVGRILYHWKAQSLVQTPWTETGELMRCEPGAGECIDDFAGEEWIQSPYFVSEAGVYYMFYGGHSTGQDVHGNPVSGRQMDFRMFDAEGQICLMTSTDGRSWTRHRDRLGYSRVFTGPGEARDPCVIRIGDLWYLYYAGYEGNPLRNGGIYVRTSYDLVHWSAYQRVHRDENFGGPTWTHECPHVVYRDGYYYLFRTQDYYRAVTHVYRSTDPMDFGIGDAGDKYVGVIACAAPEIHVAEGLEFVSSNHDPALGTQLCRLRWIPV